MEVSLEEISEKKEVKSSHKKSKKPSFTFKQHSAQPTIPKIEMPQIQVQQNRLTEIPTELKKNIKPMIFRVMSMPAKERAPLLNAKLMMSDYMNKYLDSYLYLDYIKCINDHAKFGLCYLFNFVETKLCVINNIQTDESNNDRRPEPANNQ